MPRLLSLPQRLLTVLGTAARFSNDILPVWAGGGADSEGLSVNNNSRYVFTGFYPATVNLSPGNYTVKVWGGAGGFAQGGSNGSAGGGGGGCVTYTYNLVSATKATLQCGTAGGSFFGDAQNGRAGVGGRGWHNGGAGGGPTNIIVFEYTSAGVYTFTTPGTSGQTCTAEITLIGGGGGGGGVSTTSSGGIGGAGSMIRGYISNLPSNTSFSVLVGSAGSRGLGYQVGGDGGAGTTSPLGTFSGKYAGGRGGDSNGGGGGGGGGGGATVLRNNATSTDILIAAGGGGGGGGGYSDEQPGGSQGRNGSITNIPAGNTNGTAGSQPNNPNNVNGGGGGGGGGGLLGGTGGSALGDRFSGFAGTRGTNYISTGTFQQSYFPNGSVLSNGDGGSGYARILIHPNVSAVEFTRGGGGGGASSRFFISGFTEMVAAGGGGGGADGSLLSPPATGGGKAGNNSSGGSAGSDGSYPEVTTPGSSGTAPGGGGGGGSDEQFDDPPGGNGSGGLNTVPLGGTGFAGGDGGRNATGAAGNNSDPDYSIVTNFVSSCARGNGSDWSGFASGGAIIIIKNET